MIAWYWLIPVVSTIVCMCCMLRPIEGSDNFGIGATLRLLWLFPLSVIYMVFFFVLWLLS